MTADGGARHVAGGDDGGAGPDEPQRDNDGAGPDEPRRGDGGRAGHDDAGPDDGSRRGDVVVLGDVLVDVVVTVDRPVATGSDTPARIGQRGGGSAANTACWLGSLGVPTRLVAGIGGDDVGRVARADLARHGVDHVGPVVADAATGTCVVIVDRSRERTMFPDRGANAHLDRFDVATLDARPAAHLHLSGYALLGDGSRDAARRALAWARAGGVAVSVDAASAAPLRSVGAARFLDWIAGCDLLFANDDEVEALGGPGPILSACRALVHKHGRHGATWTDGTRRRYVEAAEVDAVDSTGAGDAFAAGWLAAAHRGTDVDGCLVAARDLAAAAVAAVGARP